MIEFRCPSCRKTIKVPDALAGKQGRCPACGQGLTAPSLAAVQVEPPQPQALPGSQPTPPPLPTRHQVVMARIKLALIGVAVLAAAAWAVYNFVPGVKILPPGTVTQGMYDQIQVGMTSQQVEQVIGLPTEHRILKNEAGIRYVEDAWVNEDESYVAISYTLTEDAWIVNDKQAFNIPR